LARPRGYPTFFPAFAAGGSFFRHAAEYGLLGRDLKPYGEIWRFLPGGRRQIVLSH